jgi:hypothetical protein
MTYSMRLAFAVPEGRAPGPVRVVREGRVAAVVDYDDWSCEKSHRQGQF